MINKTIDSVRELRDLLKKSGEDPEKFFPTCRGCGFCCLQATCSLGVNLFGSTYPCPALSWNGKMHRCKLAGDFADRLYIGSGCCSPLNSWREDIIERRES